MARSTLRLAARVDRYAGAWKNGKIKSKRPYRFDDWDRIQASAPPPTSPHVSSGGGGGGG
jgi:hypothetical protein